MPNPQKGEQANSAIELLKSSTLFSSFNDKQLKNLAKELKEKKYNAGDLIEKEGEVSVAFYLILDGEVEVRRKSKVLTKLGRGQFFGEMSLLDKYPRSADVVATKPTTCLIMTAWQWEALVLSEPKVAIELLKTLARRLRATDKALTD
ncbi:MAG: cyclic nucleotide-binding domain-containing protein [Nitrososphaerota archaeon]|nr:cyclic nucleotide-binding domain-containing protein [Nitrososphaerota archaeon]